MPSPPHNLNRVLEVNPEQVRDALESLYKVHDIDETVAAQVKVSVSSLKRTLKKLKELGLPVRYERRRGKRKTRPGVRTPRKRPEK